MKKLVILIIVIAVLAGGAWIVYKSQYPQENPSVFGSAHSDGNISFGIPSSEFGLAVRKEQILVQSYIPPCDENFLYCIYYIGSAFQGTNFESSGIRIEKRNELNNQQECLTSQPAGYEGLTSTIFQFPDYALSYFPPLGNAAAGHYSNGTLYRLFYNSTCYEIETRIGESQFANYPAGTIKEFTLSDRTALFSKLEEILNNISLKDGTKVSFPKNI